VSKSVAEARVDAVELPQQRRPVEHAERAAHLWLVVHVGRLDHVGRDFDQFGVAGHRRDLRLAGELEAMHGVERLRDRLRRGLQHAAIFGDERERALAARDGRGELELGGRVACGSSKLVPRPKELIT